MKLIEKILLEFRLTPSRDAEEKISKIGDIQKNMNIVKYFQGWFAGAFMGGNNYDAVPELLKDINTIKNIYGTPSVSKMYRALHLRVPKSTTVDQIKKMNKIKTGPLPVQSWSLSPQGAMWYFKHFAIEQNQSGTPEPDKAWVLVEAEPQQNLKVLITAEEINQYFSDLAMAESETFLSDMLERLATNYNNVDMNKQVEILCKVTSDVKVKVIDVMIPPST